MWTRLVDRWSRREYLPYEEVSRKGSGLLLRERKKKAMINALSTPLITLEDGSYLFPTIYI